MKTRMYQAEKLNIFKLIAYSTENLTDSLLVKIFKDLPQ